MSKVFNWSAHRRLWLWLAEHPEAQKHQWPEWDFNGGTVDSVILNCFACGTCEDCEDCPLVWPKNDQGSTECSGYGGLWETWHYSTDPQERSELALRIAMLPVKPGIICV